MKFEEMKPKADKFFEFPTENKDHVTTTSAVLFAMAISQGTDKLNELLSQYPKFEALANETEKMRDLLDSVRCDDAGDALRLAIDIDTNMMELMNYHVMLSTECLKLGK